MFFCDEVPICSLLGWIYQCPRLRLQILCCPVISFLCGGFRTAMFLRINKFLSAASVVERWAQLCVSAESYHDAMKRLVMSYLLNVPVILVWISNFTHLQSGIWLYSGKDLGSIVFQYCSLILISSGHNLGQNLIINFFRVRSYFTFVLPSIFHEI